MKNERNVTILDSVIYCIVMFAANIVGTFSIFLFNAIVRVLIGVEGMGKFYGFLLALYAAVGIAATVFVTRFYFRYKISEIVPKKNTDSSWKLILSSCLFMVLPGEILRFILASLPTEPGVLLGRGYRFFDGLFAFPANFVYDRIYLMPNNRTMSISEAGYTFMDNFLFIMVYLVYFIITIALLYLIFSRVWRRYEDERRNEVKIHMDPEQMK